MKSIRMSMRGIPRFKFKFMRQDASVQLRQTCKLAKNYSKQVMQQTISEIIEGRIKQYSKDLLAQTNSYLEESKIQNSEFLKFDIRKKNQEGFSFIDNQLLPSFSKYVDLKSSKKTFVDAQELENSVKLLRDTSEATKNSYILDRKLVHESLIPLEALYNPTIERIKAVEMSKFERN
jgi:hypothetical protein